MDQGFGMGFGIGFDMFNIMFGIVFILIVGTIIFTVVKGAHQWDTNNRSPVLTVEAKVVSKRVDVTHHNHMDGNSAMHHSSSTRYFVTFEVESGDRMEFNVKNNEYGMLVEGDTGKLTFQGTRYVSFNRNI